MLKDDQAAVVQRGFRILRTADGPGEFLHAPQPAAQAQAGVFPVRKAVGNEIRRGQEAGHQVGQQEGRREYQSVAVLQEIAGELAAHDLRAMAAQPPQHARVEGLDAVDELREAVEQLAGALCQLGVIALVGLDLDDQRRLALMDRQDLLQIGHGLVRSLQTAGCQLLSRHVAEPAVHAGGALQAFVVHDDELAVLGQMDIQLGAVAMLHCTAEGKQGVLRHAVFRIVQAAVGIIILTQSGKSGFFSLAENHEQPQKPQRQKHDQADPNSFHFSQSSTSKASSPFLATGLLSPCMTKSMVTKASATNTVA